MSPYLALLPVNLGKSLFTFSKVVSIVVEKVKE